MTVLRGVVFDGDVSSGAMPASATVISEGSFRPLWKTTFG